MQERVPSTGPSLEDLNKYLMQVGHALNLVCELPEWLEHAPLAKHLRHATAESFAMNCRVLVEFLWSTARMPTDIKADDYCEAGWNPGEQPERIKFVGDKHVAHMTAARIHDPLVDLTYDERAEVRDELLEVVDDFANAIIDPGCTDTMTFYVKHARTLARWPPPPTAGEDPSSFIEAITHHPRPSP